MNSRGKKVVNCHHHGVLSSFPQNAVFGIEMASVNNNTADNRVPVRQMILSPPSPADEETSTDEASPYLEIIEYSPLRPATRSWELPRENVTIEKIIGKGAFGQVAQGVIFSLQEGEGTTAVAIKMLKGTASLKAGTANSPFLWRFPFFRTGWPDRSVRKLNASIRRTGFVLVH